ncbi:MAG TPA: class I lanthipeptide [Frankiaceae bacterium]|nr:class I lanthipeptide [Frankiaceae bacterium]
MTTRRTLSLRKETLSVLNTDELSSVVGASHQCVTYTKLVTGCVCTGIFPSLNVDCPSVDLNCPR